jgi:hypothetical protein
VVRGLIMAKPTREELSTTLCTDLGLAWVVLTSQDLFLFIMKRWCELVDNFVHILSASFHRSTTREHESLDSTAFLFGRNVQSVNVLDILPEHVLYIRTSSRAAALLRGFFNR